MGLLTVLCVLKSGGGYDAEWVRKLKDGVARHLKPPYRFQCLSDVDVPDRIPLEHDWPGWWSKIEMFKPGVITGQTLYLDLDTVICGSLESFRDIEAPFAMLQNFNNPDYIGSGVMWFKDAESVPHKVYQKFARMPDCYIAHHERVKNFTHVGDQAFIADTLGVENITRLDMTRIKSFKFHARSYLPEEASIVCFHGQPRLPDIKAEWIVRHWK